MILRLSVLYCHSIVLWHCFRQFYFRTMASNKYGKYAIILFHAFGVLEHIILLDDLLTIYFSLPLHA